MKNIILNENEKLTIEFIQEMLKIVGEEDSNLKKILNESNSRPKEKFRIFRLLCLRGKSPILDIISELSKYDFIDRNDRKYFSLMFNFNENTPIDDEPIPVIWKGTLGEIEYVFEKFVMKKYINVIKHKHKFIYSNFRDKDGNLFKLNSLNTTQCTSQKKSIRYDIIDKMFDDVEKKYHIKK